ATGGPPLLYARRQSPRAPDDRAADRAARPAGAAQPAGWRGGTARGRLRRPAPMMQLSGIGTLETVIGSYPHTAALKAGEVAPDGYALTFTEVSPIIAAFRRMVRSLEFDVCEMALSTYLVAREHAKPFTAIPVFLVRGFHHDALAYNARAGISGPKDLEGKRVGVRAYTVTTGVWARGILASQYGVDLDKVTWVVFDEEHVQEYQTPGNVETAPAGAKMAEMLAEGALDAAIGAGAVDSPDVRPLFPDARAAVAAWYQA